MPGLIQAMLVNDLRSWAVAQVHIGPFGQLSSSTQYPLTTVFTKTTGRAVIQIFFLGQIFFMTSSQVSKLLESCVFQIGSQEFRQIVKI